MLVHGGRQLQQLSPLAFLRQNHKVHILIFNLLVNGSSQNPHEKLILDKRLSQILSKKNMLNMSPKQNKTKI